MWLYPRRLAEAENVGFTARSGIADISMRYARCEVHALGFAMRGFYEWRNVVLVNAICRPGDTIIDIGANLGTETLLYARRVGPAGKVIAFEPMPDNFATLADLVQFNQLQNVELHQAAVSDAPGALTFLPPPSAWSTGVGRVAESAGTQNDGIQVNAVTLDGMYAEGAFSELRLVVMDVEGVESLVLRGAQRTIAETRPYLILEIQPKLLTKHGLSVGDMHEQVQAFGYHAFAISSWGLAPAEPDQDKGSNWLCIPAGEDVKRVSGRLGRRIFAAATLPPWRHVSPLVVPNDA